MMTTFKKQHLHMLLFLFTIFCHFPVLASEDVDMYENAEAKAQWYNLNHYDHSGRSDIVNADYFIVPQGQTNPDAEYQSFIHLLKTYQDSGDNVETLCHYPARLTYAEHYFKWFPSRDRPYCKDFIDKTQPDAIQSISLIFASGYFDNPSSYYGHTLLRYNYDQTSLNQKQIDASLNYGADITDQEGTLSYVVKGLIGGYSASYKKNDDFINSHRYTNGQLRDLWDYRLNLTPDQIRFVAEHGWEMRRAKFIYYFLNDNCAHRIINLVERATHKDLTQSHGFWLLPIQVVYQGNLTQNNGIPLIEKETYYPSLKSTFSKRYQSLTNNQKDQFIAFFDADRADQAMVARTIPTPTLLLILDQLDIMIANLSIKKKQSPEKVNNIESQRRIILLEILKREKEGQRPTITWPDSYTLLNAKPSSVFRAGYTHRADNNALTLHYQIANNDFMDKPLQGQEKSRFIMGSIEADITDNDITIRDVTLVDIANINTNPLPMHLTDEYSWHLRFGYNARNNICDDCGSFGITGKLGKAIKPTDNLVLFTLNGLRLNHRKTDDYNYITAISENGLLWDANDNGRFMVGVDYLLNPIGGTDEFIFKTQYAADISPNKDIRIEFDANDKGNIMTTVRLGHYFN